MEFFEIVFFVMLGFFGLEVLSIGIHKFLFHGPLWWIHQTHHGFGKKSWLEKNDLFSFFFSGLALGLIFFGAKPDQFFTISSCLGIGVTLYGVLYFILHDLWTHRRLDRVFGKKISHPIQNRYVDFVIRSHRTHHQKNDQKGQGPYGLFLGK